MLVGLTVEYQKHFCYTRYSHKHTMHNEEVEANIVPHNLDEYKPPLKLRLAETEAVANT